MKILLVLLKKSLRYLRLSIVVVGLSLSVWILFSAYLKLQDGQLSDEKISAQQERLNAKLYDQFEAAFPKTNSSPSETVTINPFTP